MTLQELIEELESLCEDLGPDTEVRLAMQPSWPFEYSIGKVIDVRLDEGNEEDGDPYERREDEDLDEYYERLEELDNAPSIVYLAEGRQLGYLPGQATYQCWG